jgi:putative transcriptional regulator
MGDIRPSLIIGFLLLLASTAGAAEAQGTAARFLRTAQAVTPVIEPAAGLFLVARRTLQDPHFKETVIYLLRHGPQGTLGLVVNRPSSLNLSDAVAGIKDMGTTPRPVFFGGPVEFSTVWMLIRDAEESRLVEHIADDIYLSGDRTVLEHLLNEKKPHDALHCYLGHAGWLPGQLALEIKQEKWYVIQTDPAVIFSANPESIWKRLIEKLDPSGLFAWYGRAAGAVSAVPPLRGEAGSFRLGRQG